MHYWELREESIKSWEHASSNEIVYFDESFEGFSDAGHITPESYMNGRVWIECHYVFQGKGDVNYVALISGLHDDVFSQRERNTINSPAHLNAVGGKSLVFVEVTEFIKSPEGMAFKSIPSVIRLKRLDFTEGFVRDSFDLAHESFSALAIPLSDNRELRMPRRPLKSSQSPNSLIESSAHVVDGIPSNQTNLLGDVMELHPNDMHLLFFIVLSGNGISLHWRAEPSDFGIKGIEVILRPTQLRIGIGHARHEPILQPWLRDFKG